MKLILTILTLISLNGYSQPLFKSGSTYSKGTQVRDFYGTIWQARTTISPAVSPPVAGTYWAYVKVTPSVLDSLSKVPVDLRQGLLDSLQNRIKELEKPMYLSKSDFELVGDSVRLRPVIFSSRDFYIDPTTKQIRIKR